jgi:hypothetical protein
LQSEEIADMFKNTHGGASFWFNNETIKGASILTLSKMELLHASTSFPGVSTKKPIELKIITMALLAFIKLKCLFLAAHFNERPDAKHRDIEI